MTEPVSDELHIGPMLVIQGSTLSCLLYLVYILGLPTLYHKIRPTVEQQEKCSNPSPTTFVDDTVITLELHSQTTNQQTLENCFDTMKTYMSANRLHINPDKTTLLVLTKNPDIRKQLHLPTDKKTVVPSKSHKYLGITVTDNLKWNNQLIYSKNSLSKQLVTRLSALRKIRPFVRLRLMKQLTNGLFASKVNYGSELWIGAPNYLKKKKIQSLQLEACRITIGPKSIRWSTNKLLKEMNWTSINSQLEISSARLIHSIINRDKPENLYHRIKQNFRPNPPDTRLTGTGRLGIKPKNTGKTTITKNHFRANSYKIYAKIPKEITDVKDPKRFKYHLKKYHRNPKYLPKKTNKITLK